MLDKLLSLDRVLGGAAVLAVIAGAVLGYYREEQSAIIAFVASVMLAASAVGLATLWSVKNFAEKIVDRFTPPDPKA